MTLVADFNPAVAVTFQRMRALLLESGGGLQEGVLGAGDLKGGQRAAGANLSADVAVGAAWVTIDTGARNGAAHIYNDAIFNAGPFTAGHATLPRIDQVVLRYNDSAIPTGTGNTPTIEVLTGTATSGATLDNRLGAAALPNDCLRLCDVLMPAVAASVTTANIRDRRPWARGEQFTKRSGGTLSVATSTPTLALFARMECSGALLKVTPRAHVTHTAASIAVALRAWVDGTDPTVDATSDLNVVQMPSPPTVGNAITISTPLYLNVAPGSHVLGLAWSTTSGTATATGAGTLGFTVEEIVRPNASND